MKEAPSLLHIQIQNQSIYSWLNKNNYIIFSELIRYSKIMIDEKLKFIQCIIIENGYDNIVFILKKENIKFTLDKAMEYFLEVEEYEKCSEIRDLLKKL